MKKRFRDPLADYSGMLSNPIYINMYHYIKTVAFEQNNIIVGILKNKTLSALRICLSL